MVNSVDSGGVGDISLAVQSSSVFSVSIDVMCEYHVTSCDHTGVSFHYT